MNPRKAALGLLLVAPITAGQEVPLCDSTIRPLEPVSSGKIIERCAAVGNIRLLFTVTLAGTTSGIVVDSAEIAGVDLTKCSSEIAIDLVGRFRFAPQDQACRASATIHFPLE